MRQRNAPDPNWPAWRYGPDGQAAIFQCAAEVPVGWINTPAKKFKGVAAETELDEAALIKDLIAKGVEINPTWGRAHMKRILDGDISPTG